MRAGFLIPLVCLVGSGCIDLHLGAGWPQGDLVETVVHGTRGPKVLMVDVSGPLAEAVEPGPFGIGFRESPLARLRAELERAREEGDIRAVLLRIDSPGGTVTASEILYRELQRFRDETDIPVVAEIMGVAASGGYYVAMAADEVLAHPTSVVGSIGVIAAGVNVAGLMQKIGVEDQTLTTGAYKDAGSPLRRMTEAERAHLGSVLDHLHERFVQVVADGRGELDVESVRQLADGRVWSAPQALEAGLIDGVGDLHDAVRAIQRRAGLTESRVVAYHRPSESRENLYSARVRPPRAGLAWLTPGFDGPGFLYLWRPGVR